MCVGLESANSEPLLSAPVRDFLDPFNCSGKTHSTGGRYLLLAAQIKRSLRKESVFFFFSFACSPSCHAGECNYFIVILLPLPPEPSFFSLPVWTKNLCRNPLPSALTGNAETSSLGMDQVPIPFSVRQSLPDYPDHFI